MKASLRSVRIAPKKAAIIAKMIRGKNVADAMYMLERTHKKGARLLEQLLRSAMANASHNEKQDPQTMIIKSLTVNKAQAYHRGVPMARGRVRRIRKFLSHINLTLGLEGTEEVKKKKSKQSGKSEKSGKDASQTTKKPVKKTAAKSKGSKSTKETASPTSKSSKSSKSP